jgi:glycosyltransferase involved in cell wall biosynthesis
LVDVSVVINAYKRRSFIKETIISAVLQNVPKDRYEVILVTDLNDDELDDIVAPYGHVIHYSNERGGAMYAKGIAEASGKVVAFLDDDDMFAQGKLKRVLDVYGSSKSLGLYRHAVTFVNERGEPLTAPQGTSFISLKQYFLERLSRFVNSHDSLRHLIAKYSLKYLRLGNLVGKLSKDLQDSYIKGSAAVIPPYYRPKNLEREIRMFTKEEKEKAVRYLAEEVHRVRSDLYDPLYWLGFNSSSMTALREPLLSYLDDISRFYYGQDNAYVLIFLASDYGIVHEPLKLTLYRVHGLGQVTFRYGDELAFIKKACNEYLELRRLVEELKLEGLIDIDKTEAGGVRRLCKDA